MPKIDLDSLASEVRSEVCQKYTDLIDSNQSIGDRVSQSLHDWTRTAALEIDDSYPFGDVEISLKQARAARPKDKGYDSGSLIRAFEMFCLENRQPFDRKFWESQLSISLTEANREALDSVETAHRLLLAEWQKQLDKAAAQWKVSKLSQLRQKILKELDEWLKVLASLSGSLKSLGLDPGIWLDISTGELSEKDIEEFRRWAEYLGEDDGAKRVAELLGKMRQISVSERIEKVKNSISIEVPVVDISSREEIVGIRLGKDIEHTLPSELALLSDPDTSILFDLKYLESRLLCFEMQGEVFETKLEEIEIEESVEEQDKLGPMILCVDTSGSMHGTPESIAKAMALFLSSKAKEQNRPCYLINFSTGITTFELTGNEGLGSLIRFLSQSFYGGTDVAPALRHALDIMAKEEYQKSDVLVLSDFIMGRLPSDVLVSIEKRRKFDNRFNSLVIGNEFLSDHMDTYFDREWVYNPHTSLIHELVHFRETALGRQQ